MERLEEQNDDTGSQNERGELNSVRKTPQDRLFEIKNRIKNFPVVLFYYCRHDTSEMFLEADLSLSFLNRLYLESQKQ